MDRGIRALTVILAVLACTAGPAAAAPPANDNRDDATELEGYGTVTGTNVDATLEDDEADDPGQSGGRSVWVRFTATEDGWVKVDVDGFDTTLAAYVEGYALPLLAANDDRTMGVPGSTVRFPAAKGASYLLRVNGFQAAGGTSNGDYTLTTSAAATPDNDDASAFTTMTAPYAEFPDYNVGWFSTVGATAAAGETAGTARSVWLRLDVPADGGGQWALGAVGADAASELDTHVEVYDATVFPGSPPVATGDDVGGFAVGGRESAFTFTAVAGRGYNIRVAMKDPPAGGARGAGSGTVTAMPLSSVLSPSVTLSGPATTTDPAVTFDVQVGEGDLHALRCQVDDGPDEPCFTESEDPFAGVYEPSTPLADGTRTVRATWVDAAGRTGSDTHTITVDGTPPETAIASGPSGDVEAADAVFTFAADEPGATFECRLDGSGFAACASPKVYGTLAKGTHTFAVRAKDAAGNVDKTPAERTWTIGAPAAAPPPASPPPNVTTVTNITNNFAFTVTGGIVGQTLTMEVPGAGTLTAVLTAATGGRSAAIARKVTVAKGRAKPKRAGEARLKLRLTKAGKRMLRKRRKLRVATKATFKPAGGGPAKVVRKTLTLRK